MSNSDDVLKRAHLAALLYGSTSPFSEMDGIKIVDPEVLRMLVPMLLEQDDEIRDWLQVGDQCDVAGLRKKLIRSMAPVIYATLGFGWKARAILKVEDLLYYIYGLTRLLDRAALFPEEFGKSYGDMTDALFQVTVGIAPYVSFQFFISGKMRESGWTHEGVLRTVMEECPDPDRIQKLVF